MTRTALVVGGTGPTGPHIVNGLLERGYDVSVFHRGTHEIPFDAEVEHLHGDPHFAESAGHVIGDRTFDVAVVTYGRIRELGRLLAGKCSHFVGVGAVNVYRGSYSSNASIPTGVRLESTEEGPLVAEEPWSEEPGELFAQKILATERMVLALGAGGAFAATYFRYPIIYGPRNIIPWEWSVVRRVRDGRRIIIVCDDAMMIRTRMACRNAAHALLLAVDQPAVATGQAYNIGDDQQYSLHQWLELLIDAAGGGLDIVSVPTVLGKPGWSLLPGHSAGAPHQLVNCSKIRAELGYRDIMSTPEALAESVAWYRENPVTAETHQDVLDAFDYELEDRLLEAYNAAMATIVRRFEIVRPEIHHHYAHPKDPSMARDHLGR